MPAACCWPLLRLRARSWWRLCCTSGLQPTRTPRCVRVGMTRLHPALAAMVLARDMLTSAHVPTSSGSCSHVLHAPGADGVAVCCVLSVQVLTETFGWIRTAVNDFLLPAFNIKSLIDWAKEGLSNANSATRTAAVQLLGTMHAFLGPALGNMVRWPSPARAHLEQRPVQQVPPSVDGVPSVCTCSVAAVTSCWLLLRRCGKTSSRPPWPQWRLSLRSSRSAATGRQPGSTGGRWRGATACTPQSSWCAPKLYSTPLLLAAIKFGMHCVSVAVDASAQG